MKQALLKLTTLTALSLALTACGGGGGSDTTTADIGTTTPTTGGGTNNPPPSAPPPTTANLLAGCIFLNNDKGFASATNVTSKTLHKLEANTIVNVWDLNDGSKKACTQTGSVEIL